MSIDESKLSDRELLVMIRTEQRVMIKDLDEIKEESKEMKRNMSTAYVSNREFTDFKSRTSESLSRIVASYATKKEVEPARNLIYGLVSVVLIAVVTGLVGLLGLTKGV